MKGLRSLWTWYKILVGCWGVGCTTVFFVFLVGSEASLILDGSVVLGTLGTSAVVLGNAYCMGVLAQSGFDDLKKRRAKKKEIADMHKAWETTTKWNDNDDM
jgi:hypothetical protein